ncbi:MAG: helix-turn-helix transcriptional regulator [Chloroflexi bacterium]|nr:helix-turn-helix transcriptional regulator [Chloroflexota bacterium]
MDMLKELMDRKMKEEKLSLRKAGAQIGVAHTTIARILAGEAVDMPTMISVCNWLGVSPSNILGSEGLGNQAVASKLASILEKQPKLAEVFKEAMQRLDAGLIPEQVVSDLVAYAAYRMGLEEKETPKADS